MSKKCPNCDAQLNEEMKFCPSCGKAILETTDKGVLKDFFKEFINYDSNFKQTLIFLLAKPGTATKEFITNGTKNITSPAKIFIITSAITFLVGTFSILNSQDEKSTNENEKITNSAVEKPPLELEFQTKTGPRIKNITYYRQEIDSLGSEKFLKSRGQNPGSFQYWIVNRTIKKYQKNDFKELNANYERNSTFLLYLLIPIFAFLLKIFKWKITFAHHVIFTLYFFSTFYLINSLSTVLSRTIGWVFSTPFLSLIFLPLTITYLIIGLRKNYQFKWIKSILVGLFSGISLLISMVLLLFFSSLLILSL